MKKGLPALPRTLRTPEERSFFNAVKDLLERMTGARGSNPAVMLGELEKLDLVQRRGNGLTLGAAGGGGTNVTNVVGGGGDTFYSVYDDETVPAAPQGVTGTSGLNVAFVSWAAPTEDFVEVVEVWKQGPFETAQTGLVREDAYLAGTSPARGGVFADPTEPSAYNYYWIRFRSYFGLVGPWHAVAAIEVQAQADPAYVLSSLSGQLNSSHLGTELTTRIETNETDITDLFDVNTTQGGAISTLENQATGFTATSNEVVAARSGKTDLAARIQTVEADAAEATQVVSQELLVLKTGEDTNLLDLSTWGSSMPPPGWSSNGSNTQNSYVTGTDPWGGQSVLWQCNSETASNADGGFISKTVSVDPTKNYRFVVAIKQDTTDGSFYVGTQGNKVRKMDGVLDTNPYFVSGDLPATDKWYLVVGYVFAYDHTGTTNEGGVYDMQTGALAANIHRSYRFADSGVSSIYHRVYQYYTASNNTKEWLLMPRIDLMDGTEPTVDALIQGYVGTIDGAISLRSELNSLGALYTAKFDVNGYIAGFGISNTGKTSSAIFKVDTFGVGSPGAGDFSLLVEGGQVVMDGAMMKSASITDAKIKDAAITNTKIASASISEAKIANAAVGSAKIKDAAVTNAKIASAAITNAKIASATITSAKIADANITSAKVATAAITSAKIASAAITNAKIASAAVDTLKIGSNAVTVLGATTGTSMTFNHGHSTSISCFVLGYNDCRGGYRGNINYTATAYVRLNGSNIATAPGGHQNTYGPATMGRVVNIPAGNNTLEVGYTTSGTTGHGSRARFITITAAKR